MRTFKQFKVGEIEYNLSFDYFSKPHPKSQYRCYLRIKGSDGRELIFRVYQFSPWNIFIPSYGARSYITLDIEGHKAQEIRRWILKFLINDY